MQKNVIVTSCEKLYACLLQMTENDSFSVEANVGLVYSEMRGRQPSLDPALDLDDLVQTGMVGLVEAANKFDPNLGNRFSTLAVPIIKSEIGRESDKNYRDRFGATTIEGARRIRTAYAQSRVLAEPVGFENDLDAKADRINYASDSLNQPILSDGEDTGIEKLETIKDDGNSIEDELMKKEAEIELISMLRDEGLSDEKITHLLLRYGIIDGEDHKPGEIAEIFGLEVTNLTKSLERTK